MKAREGPAFLGLVESGVYTVTVDHAPQPIREQARDPWSALHALAHRLCRRCHVRERIEGEKFCGPCKSAFLRSIKGYLTVVPPPTKRSGPNFHPCSPHVWDDVVNAYEHVHDPR